MQKLVFIAATAVVALAASAGCSSSSTAAGTGGTAPTTASVTVGSANGGASSSTTTPAASTGSANGGAGGGGVGGGGVGGGAGGAACTGTVLTVMNFDSWCSVTVNGTPSDGEPVCVPAGTVNLVATANAGFELGTAPWQGTDTSTAGTATVAVTTGAKCVAVCCPFGPGGAEAEGTGCPATNPCP